MDRDSLAAGMAVRHRLNLLNLPFHNDNPCIDFMVNFPPVRSDTYTAGEGTVIAVP
jgi:hypothetical protein